MNKEMTMKRIVSAALVLSAGMAMGEVEVRVRPTAGGPQIHVNGKAVVPRFFFGAAHDKATLTYCKEAGVRFISVAPSLCWAENGENWTDIDAAFDKVLKFHPTALIVPRVYVNAPKWLMNKHPEWKMVFRSGKDYGGIASVCAHDYRAMAAAHLEKLVRHLRQKYPDNFAGVHPSGQSYGEFFYMESLGGDMHGLERPVTESWRQWLKAKGEADWEKAERPTYEEWMADREGMLRDPIGERRIVLFAQFLQEELADFVAAMAEAARKGSDGKTLVMFFHGYGFEHMTVPNSPAITGDYGSEYLLTKAAGNIDIICSPFSYVNRKYLAPTMTQTAAESITMRGVMVLDEDDTRTYMVPGQNESELAGGWVKPTKAQTLHQMRSNLTACITRGRACWWMDLFGNGWYSDRDIWRAMEELRPLDEEMLGRKGPFEPEIAFTLDERGMMYAGSKSRVAFQTLTKTSREWLERCGTTYGQYYSSDAIAGKLKAKLQIFTSSFYVDDEMMAAIKAQRKAQPEITRVWCWAPGWLSKQGKSEENMSRLTGFKMKRIGAAVPEVTATTYGKMIGLPDTWKGAWVVDPLFAAEVPYAESLATWPDGTTAVAMRKSKKGYEIFCGIPAFTTQVIAAFAKLAGCTMYAPADTAYVRAAEGKVFIEKLDEVLK